MLFSKTLALAVAFAPAIFAAPAPVNDVAALERRYLSPETISKLQDGQCDLSKAIMPSGKPSHFATLPTTHQLTQP